MNGILANRSRREWILDGTGLFVQLVFVPLIQMIVLSKILKWLMPTLSGSWNLAAPTVLLLSIIVIDYLYYWNHRLLHKKFFWPAHAVHHSISKLDAIATWRNTLWSPLLTVGLWANGLLFYLLRDRFWLLVGITVTVALELWKHSNSQAPTSLVGKFVAKFLVTPHDHTWHHSSTHADLNFGGNFNFWDKIHGTFSRRNDMPKEIGIPTNLAFAQEFWGIAPDSNLLNRAMGFFPLLTIGLSLGSAYLSVVQMSWLFAGASLFFLYIFPVLIFRLSGDQRTQLLYIAVPSLEGILRVTPGAYSAWMRVWGSQIGTNVYWSPRAEILDRSALEIDDNAFIAAGPFVGLPEREEPKIKEEVRDLSMGIPIQNPKHISFPVNFVHPPAADSKISSDRFKINGSP